jgi:arylsulfatase A
MPRRRPCWLIHGVLLWLALGAAESLPCSAADADKAGAAPNVVVVFADDLAYGDLGCYGAEGYATPHLDRMAAEGLRFTDFYVAQAVCSASRAALLTGCYPNRLGLLGALGPGSQVGIHDDETTLAEVLRPRGYVCGALGKWHLGDGPRFLPTRHGFDEYFGLPYSNDMWPKHPELQGRFPDLPLIDGEQVIETNPDQSLFTTRYTERAVAFIERHHERPFFLYLAHTMPHVPLGVSDRFAGHSQRGLFGDVIEEIDWSVGQVLETIARLGLDERTLVVFTSDNGPWLSYGDHAGSTAGLREGKGTSFEGGVRVPCIARWPGHVPAGAVCREPAMTIDLLPTIARLVGADLPTERPIDGLDISPLLLGEQGATCPHDALYFYWGQALEAVRSGMWKLHFPHKYRTLSGVTEQAIGGQPVKYRQAEIGLALFDLAADPGETRDVAAEHPEVVERLLALAERARADLGDTATERVESGVREPGKLPPQ